MVRRIDHRSFLDRAGGRIDVAKDSSQMARDYIDGALKARANLGRSAKPSKAAYERAVRQAKQAMEELMSLASRSRKSTHN